METRGEILATIYHRAVRGLSGVGFTFQRLRFLRRRCSLKLWRVNLQQDEEIGECEKNRFNGKGSKSELRENKCKLFFKSTTNEKIYLKRDKRSLGGDIFSGALDDRGQFVTKSKEDCDGV